MDYKSMKFEDIVNWCKENNEVNWLKDIVADFEAKNERKITFIELKRAFVEKFMPEIAPAKKVKKPSMYDIIASL